MKYFAIVIALLLIVSSFAQGAAIKFGLNWVPEPEFGGVYAAQQAGIFKNNGLDVEIIPGGAGAPTWQQVASGGLDFAVASADEVIIARAQGADVVAIFTTYQTNPQGIMAHALRAGLKEIGDVFKSGTLAIEPGLPYTKFLEKKYGSEVKRVPYDGGIANFLADKNFAQQCFITSEPIAAKNAGSDPQVFLIADSGYNPYTAVVITRSAMLKDKPDLVKSVAAALKDGWRKYLDDPKSANDAMGKINKSMDAATFAAAAEAQKPLIETEESKKNGLGAMTSERWQTLIGQLKDMKIIDKAPDAEGCFRNP